MSARAQQLGPCRAFAHAKQELEYLSQLGRHRDESEQFAELYEFRVANRLAFDAARLDPAALRQHARFAALVCEWVARQCCAPREASFPEEPPASARLVPESLVSSAFELLDAVGGARDVADPGQLDDALIALAAGIELPAALALATALLAAPKAFVYSPHLRARIGDAIHALFLPRRERAQVGDGEVEIAHPRYRSATDLLRTPFPFVAAQLVPALMGLFGDVEQTGYGNVTRHRINVGELLNFLWGVPAYEASYFAIVDSGSAIFVSFTQGLVSHTSKYLGDGLKGLPVIRELRELMADAAKWGALEADRKADKRKLLAETEQTVQGCFFCASQTTPLLALLTSRPAICRRLVEGVLLPQVAAMLVQGIELLAGPRAGELKVSDASSALGFKPRALLRELLTAFLNLAAEERFIEAVAGSAMWRSSAMLSAVERAERVHVLEEPGATARLRAVVARIDAACGRVVEEEGELGDVPERFADPLIGSLMRDPVRVGGTVYDRSSITQQILADPRDPYTRAPIRLEDIVPQPELKAEIETWLRERKEAAAAAAADAAAAGARGEGV
jgi:hypothetical protein